MQLLPLCSVGVVSGAGSQRGIAGPQPPCPSTAGVSVCPLGPLGLRGCWQASGWSFIYLPVEYMQRNHKHLDHFHKRRDRNLITWYHKSEPLYTCWLSALDFNGSQQAGVSWWDHTRVCCGLQRNWRLPWPWQRSYSRTQKCFITVGIHYVDAL